MKSNWNPFHTLWPENEKIKKGLLLLLTVTVLKSIILIGLIPAWQGPDESVHFAYVQFIAEEKSIPVYKMPFRNYQTDISQELTQSLASMDKNHVSFNPINIQRFLYKDGDIRPTMLPPPMRRVGADNYRNNALSYSPLYYGLMAVFYYSQYSQPIENRLYAVRFGTALLMIPFVLATFGIGRILLGNELFALTFTGFVTFQPMVTYIFCIVNNDAILIMSTAVAFYFMARFLMTGHTSSAVFCGLFTGISILAKTQGFFMLPVWILTIMLRWAIQKKHAASYSWKSAFLGTIIIFAVFAPWAIFSHSNYNNVLGPSVATDNTAALSDTEALQKPKYPQPSIFERLKPVFFRWPYTMFVSFWGNFGYLDTPIHEATASYLWAFFIISCLLVGGAVLTVLFRKKKFPDTFLIFLFALAVIYILDLLLSFYLYSSLMYEGGQGRYYFSVWILMAASLYYSIGVIMPRRYVAVVYPALSAMMVYYYFYAVYGVLAVRYYL